MSNLKVALYVRVSTTEQEEENQLRQLRDYCLKSNWDISDEHTYKDFISGKEESRPDYDRLFVDAHQKKFNVVLFWALDRFARSGTLFTLQKLKELENLNISWHSYTEPYISSVGPWKDVVISIFATVAKLERERISDRTKAAFSKNTKGITVATKSGKKVGRPSIPKSIEVDVIRLLKEGNLSYVQISNMLTYKTKYGKVHHVSPAQITKIKQLHLEIGGSL